VPKTHAEREHEARQAKLAHVREQVASGQLVIREMSAAEREKWAVQDAQSEARATPVERARRTRAIENRRRRQERLAS
jgi:hypothetical protein